MKKKVLIVSSNKLFSHSLLRALTHNDEYEAVEIENAEIAVSYSEEVSLYIVQDKLADISGIELCKQLSARYLNQRVPIIVFSHHFHVEEVALKSGASGFLKIPCSSRQVKNLADQCLLIKSNNSNTELETTHFDQIEDNTTKEVNLSSTPQTISEGIKKLTSILLVDDSQLIHASVGKTLEDNGFQVFHAMNGKEGIKKAFESKPDLILCDIEMPEMNGYEMCSSLKSSDSTGIIPFIFLSSHASGVDIDKAFDSGANDFLSKPVDESELISRINYILVGEEKDKKPREKILVVDDSLLIRNMMKQGLSQQGFEVLTGDDGENGLDLARLHKPDLVVTDFDMPKMNGRELTRELKKIDELSDIPVLMLTASDTDIDRAKGEHAGVSTFLSKPFPPDKLVVIAEKLIAERRMTREREMLEHYVSESAITAAKSAAESREKMKVMRAEKIFTTVLFTDIVGFTPLTEKTEPEELLDLLNGYFDQMTQVLKKNNATIDKFIGDAIMALFPENNGLSRKENAYNAIRSGIEMIEALRIYNSHHLLQDNQISMRIGINSGDVIMGDIGSVHYRRDYTVIGDNVNIAARLESNAEANSVLISNETYNLVKQMVSIEQSIQMNVKGKKDQILTHMVSEITC